MKFDLMLIMKKRSTGQKHGVAVGINRYGLLSEILYIDDSVRLLRCFYHAGEFNCINEKGWIIARYNEAGLLRD